MSSMQPASEPPLPSKWALSHFEEVAQWNPEMKGISERRSARVNLSGLREAVKQATSLDCILVEWVAEGGHNQIYLARLIDDSEVIVRLAFPFPHQGVFGDAFKGQEEMERESVPYKVLSEVATMNYLRENTALPVAEIFAFDSALENPVGTPYIIMERLQGEMLSHAFVRANDEGKKSIVSAVAHASAQILSLPFDSIGSLCQDSLSGAYSIGHIVPPICTEARQYPMLDGGPWVSASQYLRALAERELGWLRSQSGQIQFLSWRRDMHGSEGDPSVILPAFISLQALMVKIASELDHLLPQDPAITRPALRHADFHFSNILVSTEDSAVITGIIDWESSGIVPLWSAHRPLDKIRDFGDKYETDPTYRQFKRELRVHYERTIVGYVPDMGRVVTEPALREKYSSQDETVAALTLIEKLASTGVALHQSRIAVIEYLGELKERLPALASDIDLVSRIF